MTFSCVSSKSLLFSVSCLVLPYIWNSYLFMISRGTYLPGLPWAASRWEGLHTHLQDPKSFSRGHVFGPVGLDNTSLSQAPFLNLYWPWEQWAECIFQERGEERQGAKIAWVGLQVNQGSRPPDGLVQQQQGPRGSFTFSHDCPIDLAAFIEKAFL